MMQVYKLDGNSVDIISCPPEDLCKGDYILVEDKGADAALVTQVVNVEYANIPGILEDLLREIGTEKFDGQDLDKLQIKSFVDMIRDAKIFRCKVRRSLKNGTLSDDISWTPSRSTSRVTKIGEKELLKLINTSENSITLGTLKNGTVLAAPISAIDGRLNIISGKKGTGKSHLSKLLVLGLASKGGMCMVFDVNGEYVNLGCSLNGEVSNNQIYVLSPGENFKVTLSYMGLGTLLSIVSTVLDLPANSAWEIRRIWSQLKEKNSLTMKNLGEAINSVTNGYVRDALLRRFESLKGSGLFVDNREEATTLEEWFGKVKDGGAIIVDLRRLPASLRKIVVEFMLSKLCNLLENWFLRAIFLFAEEAHLYLRETYWEDIVTRMRHLGIFPTFITNQPDSISDSIYRQADNIFLFNFTNENDLATVSKATMVDAQTVNTIAKELSPHHCLILGKVVNDFPLIMKAKELKVRAMGETRLFFTNLKNEEKAPTITSG
ncbi:MAG: ATP-binding protein [Candidatus Bathyarchaeota archaeon]